MGGVSVPKMNLDENEFSMLCHTLALCPSDGESSSPPDQFRLLPVHLQGLLCNNCLQPMLPTSFLSGELPNDSNTSSTWYPASLLWPTTPSMPFSPVPYFQSACIVSSGLDNNTSYPTPPNSTSNILPLPDPDYLTAGSRVPCPNPLSPVTSPPTYLCCPNPGSSPPQSSTFSPPRDLPQQLLQHQRLPPSGIFGTGVGVPPIFPRGNNNCNRGTIPSKRHTHKKWGYRLTPYVTSSLQVDGLIAELAAAHWESSTYDVKTWASSILGFIGEQMTMFQDQSLCSIVLWCTRLQARNVQVNFLWMINLIQLVCKCQSIRRHKGSMISLSQIYHHELRGLSDGPVLSMFLDWHAASSRFAALAGAGSVYLLILIAGLGLRVAIGSMSGQAPFDLANTIQAPVKADHCQLILNFIALTIVQMKQVLPLNVDILFSPSLRAEYDGVMTCQEWSQSDDFFDFIGIK